MSRMRVYESGLVKGSSSGRGWKEWLSRETEYKSDMRRGFGEGNLPVKDAIPGVIRPGIENAKREKGDGGSISARKSAVDHLFGMASLLMLVWCD